MSNLIGPAPTSLRGWLRAAEAADLGMLFGELHPDGAGRLRAMFITLGPKPYVRRLAERFGQRHGYAVAGVRRHGRIGNPVTGEMNTGYIVEFRRPQ